MGRRAVSIIPVELTYDQAYLIRKLLRQAAVDHGFNDGAQITPGSLIDKFRTLDRKIRAAMNPGDFKL